MAAESMERLADQYRSRAVRSVFIYTREAHPAEDYRHHRSMDEKRHHARAFVQHSRLGRQILPDDLPGASRRAKRSGRASRAITTGPRTKRERASAPALRFAFAIRVVRAGAFLLC